MRLDELTPTQRFRLTGEAVTGTLVRVDRGSATVRLDGLQREVEFVASDGTPRRFEAQVSRVVQWSRGTLVTPLEEA